MKPSIAFIAPVCLLACGVLKSQHSYGAVGGQPLSRVQEIKELKDIEPALAEKGSKRTLLVLDIDDTLLTSAEFFGSDAWYEWQKTLPPAHTALVACKFDVIAMNYETGIQKTTQPDAPDIINAFKGDKIILTSRSLAARAATLRELEEAGYEFPAALSQRIDGILYPWDPKDPKSPTISYHRGVVMGAGQNKGELLVRLLKQAGLKYERVILVDDGIKNIENMRIALEKEGIEYRGLLYTRIEKAVSPEREQLATQGWLEWQHLLATTFPGRLARMQAGNCAY